MKMQFNLDEVSKIFHENVFTKADRHTEVNFKIGPKGGSRAYFEIEKTIEIWMT